MFLNKVEICGVNTSELPLLSDEEKENLSNGDTYYFSNLVTKNREIWMPENNM